MASIPTFQSTTLEGLVLEAILMMQEKEINSAKNPQNLNLINLTVDTDEQEASVEIRLPIDVVPTQNGSYVVARPYLLD